MIFECRTNIACECGGCDGEGSQPLNDIENVFKLTRLQNHLFELSGVEKTMDSMADLLARCRRGICQFETHV